MEYDTLKCSLLILCVKSGRSDLLEMCPCVSTALKCSFCFTLIPVSEFSGEMFCMVLVEIKICFYL